MLGIYNLDFRYGLPFTIIDSVNHFIFLGPIDMDLLSGFQPEFHMWKKSKEVLVAGVQSKVEVEQRETRLLHLIQNSKQGS